MNPVRIAGLFILALLGLAGCYREVTDASADARIRPSAAALWTIGGVRFELPVFGEASGHFLARRIP